MTDFKARYDRNYNTLTREDQAVLARSCVAVIGLGGLGGGVCELLARTGVGHLTLVDGDRFDVSNLNRQLLSREDLVGTLKADAARERIQAVNSSVRVTAHSVFGDDSNLGVILKGACLVVDCLDTIDARFVLQDAAQKAEIPIVSGAIAGVTGQVMVIFPGDPGYERVYGSRKTRSARGIETETGNLSFCALFVASLQVSECVKILIGKGEILRHKLLIADLWRNTIEQVDLG
jgi:molybdopterin/thiamine biosynthesis adenylyltransferase